MNKEKMNINKESSRKRKVGVLWFASAFLLRVTLQGGM